MIKKTVLYLLVGFLCCFSIGSYAENDYGSAGVQVTDGSELKLYQGIIELLKKYGTWVTISSVRAAGPNDNFKMLNAVSKTISAIVVENGGADIPVYETDSLNLKNMEGFRNFAEKSKANPSFIADDTTCGAAVVFVYPAEIAMLLMVNRPGYIFDGERTQAEWDLLGKSWFNAGSRELESLKYFCSNYKDKRIISGITTLYANMNSDIQNIVVYSDKDFKAENFPFTATLTCGMNGQNMNVLACFTDTDLKVIINNQTKLYKVYNLGSAGNTDREGLHISLPEHFSILAQNSQKTLILGLVIKDVTGKILYSDQQSQYGVISVKH